MIPLLRPRVTALIKDRPAHVLTCVFIAALWIILVLPSAFVNALFPLDLGGLFDLASHFPANLQYVLSPRTESGRYFPLYWLYHMVLSSLFGFDVKGYYLVLAVVFLLGSLLLGVLFASVVRHTAIALLFSLALFMSSPNVETLYTLGKAEPLVYLLISLILFLFYYGNAHRKVLSIPRCGAITMAFACALWFKETSIAMFAFAATGIAADLLFNRNSASFRGSASPLRRYARLLICLVVGLGLSKLPFLIFPGVHGTAAVFYTKFSLTWQMIAGNVFFYLTQQPDITVLGMIASFFVLRIISHAMSGAATLDDKAKYDLIFIVSLLVMAWSYLSIFLLWRWSMAYYLHLPAIIFRFVAGYGLYMVIRLELCGRIVRIGSCVAMSLLLLHAGIYLWYAGSTQVAYSRVYTDALRQYLKLSHRGDSLIFESYPFYSEQLTDSLQFINLVYHEQRRVFGIADLVDPAVNTPEMRQLLAVSDADLVNNEKNWPKRDDYVIVLTGNELATWQVRGVGPFYSEGSFLQKDGSYDMQEVAGGRSYFPTMFINVWTHSLDLRQTYVGYEIYRVLGGPRFTWVGRYPDGWVGRRARLTLYPEYVANALVHVSTSKYNPHNSVRVFQDDVLIDKAALSEGEEHTFTVRPASGAKPAVFRFEVDRTFVPRKLRLNKDQRELGAFVRLEPFAAKGK